MIDLYNSKKRLERQMSQIDSWDTSKKNKEFVKKFLERCKAENMSEVRRLKYIYELKKIVKWLDKDMDNVSKDDIIELVNKIQDNGYAQRTIGDFKLAIKKIYWILFSDHKTLSKLCDWMYDKRTRYLKDTFKAHLQEKKGEPLTEEEFGKIISKCKTIRDKCLLSIAFEGGFRPSELLGIKINDIKKNDYGFKVEVAGKTGTRWVYLVKSAIYLGQYLNAHPCKDKKDNYLFVNNKGKLISLRRANYILQEVITEAKIEKPTNLYFLRSSAVTRDRKNGMSTGALEKKFGWVAGSKVVRAYDRSTSQDYEDEVKRIEGIEEKNKVEEVKKCQRCGTQLGYGESYCTSCGLANEEQKKLDRIKSFLTKPEVLHLFEEFMKK